MSLYDELSSAIQAGRPPDSKGDAAIKVYTTYANTVRTAMDTNIALPPQQVENVRKLLLDQKSRNSNPPSRFPILCAPATSNSNTPHYATPGPGFNFSRHYTMNATPVQKITAATPEGIPDDAVYDEAQKGWITRDRQVIYAVSEDGRVFRRQMAPGSGWVAVVG